MAKTTKKRIELTDKEISTLLYAVGNEFNRVYKRRCIYENKEPSIVEENLLSVQDRLYKLLVED